MRSFWLAVTLVLVGCKGPCRLLSEKLCDCRLNNLEREECLRIAATNTDNTAISADDAVACQALLDANQCDCRLIDTPQGKERCGLARQRPSMAR